MSKEKKINVNKKVAILLRLIPKWQIIITKMSHDFDATKPEKS
jgi:hypothetical protein